MLSVYFQILTNLEIYIPLGLMLQMFKTGVDSLTVKAPQQPPQEAASEEKEQGEKDQSEKGQGETKPLSAVPPGLADVLPPGSPMSPMSATTEFAFETPRNEEKVPNITCFIMMLDITLKQVCYQDRIILIQVI